MPETIENYTPQSILGDLRKHAFKIWGVVLFLSAAWVFLILLAPVTKVNDLIGISSPLYSFYSYICHQIPSRSFHVFEHQFAVCSRCFGVYFGLFIGLLSYPIFRSMEKIDPFPRIWLILSTLPIAVDWSLTFFGIWENTQLSRVLTGLILGMACAVFIVPALVELSQILLLRQQKEA